MSLANLRSNPSFWPFTVTGCILMLVPAHAHAQTTAADELVQLNKVTVTAATRTEKLASALPVTTTVIDRGSLDQQLIISTDLAQVLAQTLPGYSPSRQKLTNWGETFRGRAALYLVDGVPQSTPLRPGSREGLTTDAFFLDRIEVVHGSSASQGMGATGGLVNFVTRAAPADDGVRSQLELTGNSSARFKSDGYGGKIAALTAARRGPLAVVAGATLERRPMAYDGEGRTLGVDNGQGDTLDSDAYGLFFKPRYDFSPRHSAELMINHFKLEQNPRWLSTPGDRATGLPTTSVRGASLGEPGGNEVTNATLTFTDRGLFGGTLDTSVFYQNFDALYGDDRAPSTLLLFRVNGVPTFDQNKLDAMKHGVRTTWVRTFTEAGNLGVVGGLDYLHDETGQKLIHTGRYWAPFITYEGWSPYLQLEKPLGRLTLTGGLRYESAELSVDDFVTLESYGGARVGGGKPSYEEPLFNLGATWRATDSVTLYGGFAQGYGMADAGRILRTINRPGLDVDTYINLEPVVTDNWEVGARFHGNGWRIETAAFLSTAKFGTRLVANSLGVYDVVREKSATYGLELNGELRLPGPLGTLGGYASAIEGKSDRNLDGDLDRRLPSLNISPSKLALHWDKSWASRFSTRVQAIAFLRRSDPDNISAGDFGGYTMVDFAGTWRLAARQTLSLGIENLLDRQYISYFSQSFTGASATGANYYAGRGRTLTLRHRFDF